MITTKLRHPADDRVVVEYHDDGRRVTTINGHVVASVVMTTEAQRRDIGEAMGAKEKNGRWQVVESDQRAEP